MLRDAAWCCVVLRGAAWCCCCVLLRVAYYLRGGCCLLRAVLRVGDVTCAQVFRVPALRCVM